MARIRSIKPEFSTSESVARMSIPARLCWVLLWMYLDDEGRGVDNARLIKAACWPLDDDVVPSTIDGWLDEMVAEGKLCRYEADGKALIHVPSWRNSQKPQHPKPSKYPVPHDGHVCPHDTDSPPHEPSRRSHDASPETAPGVGGGEGAGEELEQEPPDGGAAAALIVAAAAIVAQRRRTTEQSTDKRNPAAWLHRANAGIVDECRAARHPDDTAEQLADRVQPPGIVPATAPPRPKADPDCPDCEGHGQYIPRGENAAVRCSCARPHLEVVSS